MLSIIAPVQKNLFLFVKVHTCIYLFIKKWSRLKASAKTDSLKILKIIQNQNLEPRSHDNQTTFSQNFDVYSKKSICALV